MLVSVIDHKRGLQPDLMSEEDVFLHHLWLPYVIGQTIYIFMLWFVLLLSSSFFSSPNLSRRRMDVCHTSTYGVASVRI